MRTKYPLAGFAERLNTAMVVHSDSWWGRRLNADRKTVMSYRHGVTVPDATTIGKICCELKTSADWFLFGRET